MLALGEPRAETTRRCTRWILQRLAIDRTGVSAVAKAPGEARTSACHKTWLPDYVWRSTAVG